MRVVLNTNQFKQIVKTVKAVNDEAVFCFGVNGLSVKQIDAGQICFLDLFLPKKEFEHFVEKEEQSIGLNFGELARVFKGLEKNKSVELWLSSDKKSFVVKPCARNSKEWVFPVIDVQESNSIPKIVYKAGFNIVARDLKQGLKDVLDISSDVVFNVKAHNIFLHGKAGSGAEINQILGVKDCFAEKPVISKFNANFLLNFLKTVENKAEVSVFVDSNTPIKFFTEFEGVKTTFFVAHQTSDDTAKDFLEKEPVIEQPVPQKGHVIQEKQELPAIVVQEGGEQVVESVKELKNSELATKKPVLVVGVEFFGKNKEYLEKESRDSGMSVKQLVLQAVNNDRMVVEQEGGD